MFRGVLYYPVLIFSQIAHIITNTSFSPGYSNNLMRVEGEGLRDIQDSMDAFSINVSASYNTSS